MDRKAQLETQEEANDRLAESLEQALGWLNGDASGVTVHRFQIEMPDVADIRTRLKLTQDVFAQKIGVPVATLRNWEQGRRHPTGPARVLLNVIDRHPDVVMDMLAAERDAALPVKAAG